MDTRAVLCMQIFPNKLDLVGTCDDYIKEVGISFLNPETLLNAHNSSPSDGERELGDD